ncbi:MAG: SBBP repeat-containing protein [Chloroflexota bacterium]
MTFTTKLDKVRQKPLSYLRLLPLVGFILWLCLTSAQVFADDLPPVLDFSTYLGGNSYERGRDIAFDANGNIYVTGSTSSPNFPASNPFNVALPNGDYSGVIYVTKYDPMGTQILYSILLGKGIGYSIAVDADGYAYVAGSTTGAIALKNPLQATLKGGTDIFVSKLNPMGNALVFSTYLGGDGTDEAFALALDASKNIYLTGYTQSTDFPTHSAYQAAYGAGYVDAFVTKLNSSGSALVYSTYYGGTGGEVAEDIAVNGNEAFITGLTSSTNFPTVNPYQDTLNPNCTSCSPTDGFVARLDAAGAPIYSTYLGGDSGSSIQEGGYGIAVDASGSAYVVGGTQADNFPTVNAYQDTLINNSGGFISRFSPDGTQLLYSTYFGGTSSGGGMESAAFRVALDANGLIYIAGFTADPAFPTVQPLQAALNSPAMPYPYFDIIAAIFSADGQTLLFSTYWGGSQDDMSQGDMGMALSPQGNMAITGTTRSDDFPTAFAVQDTPGGPLTSCCSPGKNYDSYVMKIGLSPVTPPISPPGIEPEQNYFITHTPTLTWTAFSGANKYHIQVARSSTFDVGTIEFDTEVSGSNLSVVTDPLVNGRHYWRVQAERLDGQVSGWSAVQSFTVRAQ